MSGEWVDKRAAADRLAVSVKTIERRIKQGKLERSIVHGPHGPEVRVWLPATSPVVEATAGEAATHDTSAAVDRFPAQTSPLDSRVAAALRGIDQVARENARLRRRNDELLAVIESLRQTWWKRWWYNRRQQKS